MLKSSKQKSERGVALLVALFALILITAVGLGMIFSSNGELSVNSSFRQNHAAYFAARAGLEEARDRMRFASTTLTNPVGMGLSDFLPTTPIGQPNSVLYIINGAGIDPTNTSPNNIYFDDEICHEINDNSVINNSPGSFNIKCPHATQADSINSLPHGNNWAVLKTAEPIPGGGTIPYAWTRINLKLNESTNPWCVAGLGVCTPQTGPDAAADQVCYNGNREFVITDAIPPRDAPGGAGGISVPSQLAMGMYFGGSNGHGTSGHSGTTGSSTTGSSTTGSSTTGSSTTGSSTTGTSGSGTSTTGTSSTSGTSTTGTSTTGTTGTSTTGTTGTSTTGTTGTSTTGTTGTSTTGTTGTSTTGTTGTSTTGTSTTGTSTSGTSTGGTTGGSSGSGGSCSGLFAPPPPPVSYQATSCANANGQPVYTVTSLAITPGKARRMLQYEIAHLTVPVPPAAVTMAGPNPSFHPTNSFPFVINGNDACTTNGHVLNNLPAIGTTTDVPANGDATATDTATAAAATIATALQANGVKTQNFTGAGCSTGDDVQNVINVSPGYNTIDGLNAVVQSVIGSADEIASSDAGVTNWGTDANPKVIAIEGNANVSSGAGVLLVTGNMVASGAFTWDGIILVIGNGNISFNGGGNGGINGAIVVANIGNSQFANNPTNSGNLLTQLGPPTFSWSGGGGNGVNFNSCLTTNGAANATFKVLTRREIVY